LTNTVDILVLGLTLLAMEFAIIALWADDGDVPLDVEKREAGVTD
jgi:hypothetical protein